MFLCGESTIGKCFFLDCYSLRFINCVFEICELNQSSLLFNSCNTSHRSCPMDNPIHPDRDGITPCWRTCLTTAACEYIRNFCTTQQRLWKHGTWTSISARCEVTWLHMISCMLFVPYVIICLHFTVWMIIVLWQLHIDINVRWGHWKSSDCAAVSDS